MGYAVDHESAGTADPLTAVMFERDRLFPFGDQFFIEHIQHFERGHLVR